MAKIHGIPVTLITKEITGYDPLGEPITQDVETVVENVIVSPTTKDDIEIISNLDLNGKHAVYTLGIPKGDTHNWSDAEVVFFGKRWRTFGATIEGIESMIPLQWNKKVWVEFFE